MLGLAIPDPGLYLIPPLVGIVFPLSNIIFATTPKTVTAITPTTIQIIILLKLVGGEAEL